MVITPYFHAEVLGNFVGRFRIFVIAATEIEPRPPHREALPCLHEIAEPSLAIRPVAETVRDGIFK
jgi:hypothetical protein